MVKAFALYAIVLGAVLAVAGVFVHALMLSQYKQNVAQRLVVMTNDAEEELEHLPRGKPIAPTLSSILKSSSEGVEVFDPHGRSIAAVGAIGGNASVQTFRGDGPHGDWIVASISNDRIGGFLRQLDLGLVVGTILAMFVGGLIITWISTRSMARIEAAYRRVYRFTGDAAHELRTPLSVITNNADRLAFDAGNVAVRDRSLNNISQAAREMGELMDGLLLLARADEDASSDMHPIDVAACVERVAQTYRSQAAVRNLTLSVGVRANATVYGQPEQVARIIANLVENAIRYTPPGGSIAIVCTLDRGNAVVDVVDTGVGIDPQEIRHVFERFWRAKSATTSKGSGLGLAIARSLAVAHGGEVSVRSRPGEGSTFTVKLPLRPRRRPGASTIS